VGGLGLFGLAVYLKMSEKPDDCCDMIALVLIKRKVILGKKIL